jgi:hypothetical protein
MEARSSNPIGSIQRLASIASIAYIVCRDTPMPGRYATVAEIHA